ncbi:hypothetical protein FQA39_LY18563 [Lamprigera yunnana]|nr:hypothetical protein FQA39_LY18563 [Lamprigera yunnana]
MQAVVDGADWQLVHSGRPNAKLQKQGAVQRADGKWVYKTVPGTAKMVGQTIHESTYDFRRARHPVPRPHQRRQQPALLRAHCRHQPLWRATAAVLRLLRSGAGSSDASLVRNTVLALAACPVLILRAFSKWWPRRCARSTTCSTSPSGRWRSSAKNPPPKRASAWALPAWATRLPCSPCATATRKAATWPAALPNACATPPTAHPSIWPRKKAPSHKLERPRAPGPRHLRQPPAQGHSGRHPQTRQCRNKPPAVDRPDRHRQPGLCRQRIQRHRATVLVDVHPQQARGRRQQKPVPGGRPQLAPVPRAGRRCEQAAFVLCVGARDVAHRTPGDDGNRATRDGGAQGPGAGGDSDHRAAGGAGSLRVCPDWAGGRCHSWPRRGVAALRRNASGGLDKLYQQDAATRAANFVRMQAVLRKIEAAVPARGALAILRGANAIICGGPQRVRPHAAGADRPVRAADAGRGHECHGQLDPHQWLVWLPQQAGRGALDGAGAVGPQAGCGAGPVC